MDYVVHERFASDESNESNERRELSASKVRQSYTRIKTHKARDCFSFRRERKEKQPQA